MNKIQYLHFISVISAYAMFPACWFVVPVNVVLLAPIAILVLAIIGFLTGLALLVALPGISRTNVTVGASTIAAFILFVIFI